MVSVYSVPLFFKREKEQTITLDFIINNRDGETGKLLHFYNIDNRLVSAKKRETPIPPRMDVFGVSSRRTVSAWEKR